MICQQVEDKCWEEEKVQIKILKASLSWYAQGGKNAGLQAKSNAKKSWLTEKEVNVIIKFVTKVANQGHGLSLWRLEEQENEILQA